MFGGSGGAASLNAAVVEAAGRWRDRDDLEFVSGDIARVVQQQPPRLAFAFEEPDIQPRSTATPTLQNR